MKYIPASETSALFFLAKTPKAAKKEVYKLLEKSHVIKSKNAKNAANVILKRT